MSYRRCPGGYVIQGNGKLCGRSGNNCRGRCAFDYLAWPLTDDEYARAEEAEQRKRDAKEGFPE